MPINAWCLIIGILITALAAHAPADEISDMLSKDAAQSAVDCINAVKSLNSTCNANSPRSNQTPQLAVSPPSPSSSTRTVSLRNIPASTFNDEDKIKQQASLMTKEQMEAAFKILKDEKEMRWDIPDLCAPKAQKGAILLQNKGVIVGKVFATVPGTLTGAFTDGDKLNPKLADARRLQKSWDYHVAPFVLFKNGGKEEKWVLDPLLFKGPVPLETWKASVDENPDRVQLRFANRFVYQRTEIYDNPTAYNPEETKAATRQLMNAEAYIRALENRH
jgi:hypothetical protein